MVGAGAQNLKHRVKPRTKLADDGWAVFFIAFCVIALLTVPLAGGRLSALADLQLRGAWLIAVALGTQVVIISLLPGHLEGMHAPVHMATYLVAGVFLWCNRAIAGMWLIALGGAANFVAIVANRGVMPASPGALSAAGMTPDKGEDFANSAALADPKLAFLGDVFAIPSSWPLTNVFSIGDLCIVAGLLVALHVACGSRLIPAAEGEFRALVRDVQFRRLWCGQAASNLGDFIYSLAVAFTVIETGKGAALLAMILIAQAGPAALTGLLGAPAVDRFSRRRLMVASDICRALAVGSLLLSSSPSSLHILGVAACLGTFGAIFQPALHASLPNVVPPRLLVAANATINATFNLAVLVGPVLGGLLATYTGVTMAFAINAASFLLSAMLIARAHIPQSAALHEGGGVRALREGLRYVAASALVRGVAVTAGVAMFAASMKQPLEPLFIVRDLEGAARDIGMAVAAWGMGMVMGSCATPALARRFSQEAVMAAGLAAMGGALLAASRAEHLTALLVFWLIGGGGNALLTVAYDTLLQQRTPDELRGRVVAANESILDAAMVAGLTLTGVAAGLLGTRGVMTAAGVLIIAAAVLVPVFLRAGFRSTPEADPATPAFVAGTVTEAGASESSGRVSEPVLSGGTPDRPAPAPGVS